MAEKGMVKLTAAEGKIFPHFLPIMGPAPKLLDPAMLIIQFISPPTPGKHP